MENGEWLSGACKKLQGKNVVQQCLVEVHSYSFLARMQRGTAGVTEDVCAQN